MKKIISIALAALMILATFVACGSDDAAVTTNGDVATNDVVDTTASDAVETPVALSFGMGVTTAYGDVTSADGETNGAGEVVATVAAVLLDAEGKIVKCDIDTADFSVEYTSAGAAVAAEEFVTKYDLGANYGMAAYGTDLNGDGKVLEWNEQVDAFETAVAGKTIDEVKAMVVDGYGNDEIATAGCTIGVSDFVLALEKAVANAAESTATADAELSLGVVASAEGTDATEDSNGSIEVDTTFVAAAMADGKVVAMVTDVLQAEFTFDALGAATTDTTAQLPTKLEKGDNYGMAAYGADLNGDGKVLEWYAQADAFNAACVGLTADEIAALVVDGYGVADVQNAGCTIGITDMAAAAVKAAQ